MTRVDRLAQAKEAAPRDASPSEYLELAMNAAILDLFDDPEELPRMRKAWEEKFNALLAITAQRVAAEAEELEQARDTHLALLKYLAADTTVTRAIETWNTDPQKMLRRFTRDRPRLVQEYERRQRVG
jgi:hypothetical protein